MLFTDIKSKLSDLKKLLSYEEFTDIIFEDASVNEDWMWEYMKIQKIIRNLEASIKKGKTLYDSKQPSKRGLNE